MARLVLCVLALLVAGGLSDPVKKLGQKVADPVLLQRTVDLLMLYAHPHEPNYLKSCQSIAKSWSLEKNIEHYKNVTAVKIYIELWENKWILPKGVPFSVNEPAHQFEAETLFNVLYSAKDYDTFYKTAVYIRELVNEYLFSYVLDVALVHRKDTEGVYIPRNNDVFPSFFINGDILAAAWRIHAHGQKHIDFYPSTYKWENNVVIRWNASMWPYWENKNMIFSATHDIGLNNWYYNIHIAQPKWLGGDVVPLIKDRRGEWFWFVHRQLVNRYYMERLANGLGEIPEISDVVEQGYSPSLLFHNGVPYPVRPWNFNLNQPQWVNEIRDIKDSERRIRDSIEQGYLVNPMGEHINLRVPEAIDVLGRVIEANVDSPNVKYYKDFISIWKKVLGNSKLPQGPVYHRNYMPLVVPSVLEQYQTALRDPAFYVIWKRVLGLFELWSEQLPHYKREELALPQVAIEKVEVDRLVTYYENVYVNLTNALYISEEEDQPTNEKVSVLTQQPRLNHKVFQVRVNVKSEVAKTVVVRFFLAPKYNSFGNEIPLHENSQNFILLDEFLHDLPVGESVIVRDSVDNNNLDETESSQEATSNIMNAIVNKKPLVVDQGMKLIKFPRNLLLPKGRVGGMPYVLMVYISEYRAPAVPFGTGFDPSWSLGCGTGAQYLSAEPLSFPVNRPLHAWQVEGLRNLILQDVWIHHKPTPEIENSLIY